MHGSYLQYLLEANKLKTCGIIRVKTRQVHHMYSDE